MQDRRHFLKHASAFALGLLSQDIQALPSGASPKTFTPTDPDHPEPEIQRAIDYVQTNGGGRVEIPDGLLPYDSSQITIGSSVHLTSPNDEAVQEVAHLDDLRTLAARNAPSAHVRTPAPKSGLFLPTDTNPFGTGNDAVAIDAEDDGWWIRASAWSELVVSAQEFGAIPDGTTDSTKAIQKALDFVHSQGGGTVRLTAQGTYMATPPLRVRSNVQVLIEPGATLKAVPGNHAQHGLIYIEKLDSDIRIAGGGHIQGNKASSPNGNMYGVKLFGGKRVAIENLKITDNPGSDPSGNLSGDAILVHASGNSLSEDIFISNIRADNNVRQGFSITGVDTCVVQHCIITNTTGTFPGAGIDIEADANTRVENVSISNTVCRTSERGILLEGASEGPHASISISGCLCENNRTDGFSSSIKADVSADLVCRNNGHAGVQLYSALHHDIHAVCLGNKRDGIRLDSSTVQCRVNGLVARNGEHGVYVKGKDATENRIELFSTGNSVSKNSTFDNARIEGPANTIQLTSTSGDWAHSPRHHLSITGASVRATVDPKGDVGQSGFGVDNVGEGTTINDMGVEAANAETPTQANYVPGTIVEFTDTGDGSGTGTYLLSRDASRWIPLS